MNGKEKMNKSEIEQRLAELQLDPAQYWVLAGGAMVMHGFREETTDIDLGCTTDLADELQRRGVPEEELIDGTRKLVLSHDIELFENWCYGQIIRINDIPVISIDGLLQMKRELGREKDLRDIQLILNKS